MCYGGDISRKTLTEKQEEGEKRMKLFSSISVLLN